MIIIQCIRIIYEFDAFKTSPIHSNCAVPVVEVYRVHDESYNQNYRKSTQ